MIAEAVESEAPHQPPPIVPHKKGKTARNFAFVADNSTKGVIEMTEDPH
jgi:hypothetical protein